jgi:NADH-quinone oxidoreductase subunit D
VEVATTYGWKQICAGHTMSESRRVAIGPTEYLPHDIALNIDDRHPLAHGGFQLDIEVVDGVIAQAEPQVGFLHRSAEKLFESRDYRQIMMLANRHDWYSSFHGELVIGLTVEEATGITPPERASMTRTLLAEVNRINVALVFAGCALPRDNAVGRAALLLRERILDWMQQVSGSRIHPMINRIGGLAHPVTPDSLDELAAIHPDLVSLQPDLADALMEHTHPMVDVAVVTQQHVHDFGLSGPVAQAAGVDTDLRRSQPYASYHEFAELLPPAPLTSGGVQGRYQVLLHEMSSSIAITAAAAERLRLLGPGPIDVPLPKVVRVPESMTYGWVEGPIGRTGAFLVSTGDKLPWRLALNTPSRHSMSALTQILRGVRVEDLAAAVSSIFMVIGDVDR